VTATPFDNVATREILNAQTTSQTVQQMSLADYGKGFQPNLLKFTTRTPLSFVYVYISSSAVPKEINPGIRGILLGVMTGGLETVTMNGSNAIRTRFIQGAKWKDVLQKEGTIVMLKGLTPALIHRCLSWSIFMGVYENLKSHFPNHHIAVSTTSGFCQVFLTSPFFITAIHKQDKNQPPLRLDKMVHQLWKAQGLVRGLLLPGLIPRLGLSAITSSPLLWLMEKLNLIQRKA
jgi:hypothetical protein